MTNVTLDAKVQVALGNLLKAGEVYASDKAEVLATIEAALTTADAPQTEMLKQLRAVVSKWNALPDVPEGERADARQLRVALADAAAFSMSDMTELFKLLKKMHQDMKEGWLKERLNAQQNKLAMANAEKALADKAAEDRCKGAVTSAAADIAGAAISGVGGGIGLAKTAQSVKKQVKAGALEEQYHEYTSIQQAGTDKKKQMKNDIADLEAKLQAPSSSNLTRQEKREMKAEINTLKEKYRTLDGMVLDHRAAFGHAAGENKLKIDKLNRGVSIDDQYSRGITALLGSVDKFFGGSGRMYAATKTEQAEKADAQRNQTGAFRDLYASQEQTAERLADAQGQATNEANSTLSSTIQSTTQTNQNVARNYS